jgi:hypothetical protein
VQTIEGSTEENIMQNVTALIQELRTAIDS